MGSNIESIEFDRDEPNISLVAPPFVDEYFVPASSGPSSSNTHSRSSSSSVPHDWFIVPSPSESKSTTVPSSLPSSALLYSQTPSPVSKIADSSPATFSLPNLPSSLLSATSSRNSLLQHRVQAPSAPSVPSPSASTPSSSALPRFPPFQITMSSLSPSPSSRASVAMNDKPRMLGMSMAPELLPGEVVEHPVHSVCEWSNSLTRWQEGTLYLTTYKISFVPTTMSTYDDIPVSEGSSIPLAAIHHVEKIGGKSLRKDHAYILDVHCKDVRTVRYSFDPKVGNRRKVFEFLQNMIAPKVENVFCFSYVEPPRPPPAGNTRPTIDGWQLYDVAREFTRQGAISAPGTPTGWRLTDINSEFRLSETYPPLLVVPQHTTNETLKGVAAFRSKGRLPVLSWLHPTTGAALTRSSQPLIGMFIRSNNTEDQKLIKEIASCNPHHRDGLVIVDLRPKANAMANAAMGAGFESAAQYKGSDVRFMGIENIHVMRECFRKQVDVCMQTGGSDQQWWSKIMESTGWMDHVRAILSISKNVADIMDRDKASVLAHCSDGWDRTAQVVTLVQLMLDPYFRTVEGFAVLIEKDWLSFGHRFHTRLGHCSKNFFEEQRGPIFLQWLEAVYQLIQQFPNDFQFTEKLLRFLADSLYSARFGTFLCDTWRERHLELKAPSKSVSVWTHILNHEADFVNPFYLPPPLQQSHSMMMSMGMGMGMGSMGGSQDDSYYVTPTAFAPTPLRYQRHVLYPDCSPCAIRCWTSYWLRFCRSPAANISTSGGGPLLSPSGVSSPGAVSTPSSPSSSSMPPNSLGSNPAGPGAADQSMGVGYILCTAGLDAGGLGESVVTRGKQLASRLSSIEDSRRMVTLTNEQTVTAFQKELRSLREEMIALQRENEALKAQIATSQGQSSPAASSSVSDSSKSASELSKDRIEEADKQASKNADEMEALRAALSRSNSVNAPAAGVIQSPPSDMSGSIA